MAADPKAGKPATGASAGAPAPVPGTSAPAPAAKPTAPAAPAAPVAPKPAAPPPPKPTGDHALLATAFPEEVLGFELLEDGQGVSVVHPDGLFAVAARAKQMGYRILSLLSGYDTGKEYGVLYAFVRPANVPAEFAELRLRVRMARTTADGKPADPACQSIVDVHPAAGWQEREAWDLYGIRFQGNPDLRRIFMPEGWHGFPGRKDDKQPEQFVAMRDGEDIVLRTQEEGSW